MAFEGNEDSRYFDFVITVPDVVDKEGEYMNDAEMEGALDLWMENNSPISMEHSNRIVGKGLRWWKEDYKGHQAYLARGVINRGTLGDVAWDKIKNKVYKDVSIGGLSKNKEEGPDGTRLDGIQVIEIALCEDGMHPNSDIVQFNSMAKDYKFFAKAAIINTVDNSIEKKVVQREDKYCVIRVHGEDAGKIIKCFDTKEEADKLHRAIQANKQDCACDIKENKNFGKNEGGLFMTKEVKKQEEDDKKPVTDEEDTNEENKQYVTKDYLESILSKFAEDVVKRLRTPALAKGDGGTPSPDGVEDATTEEDPSTGETDSGGNRKETADVTNKQLAKLINKAINDRLGSVESVSTPKPIQKSKESNKDLALKVALGEVSTNFTTLRKSMSEDLTEKVREIISG